MSEHKLLTAEEMLEQIFSYMNRLYKEKDFNKSLMLLTDLGRSMVNAERASFWYRDVDKGQYWTLAALGTDRITVEKGTGIVGVSIENNMTLRITWRVLHHPRISRQGRQRHRSKSIHNQVYP